MTSLSLFYATLSFVCVIMSIFTSLLLFNVISLPLRHFTTFFFTSFHHFLQHFMAFTRCSVTFYLTPSFLHYSITYYVFFFFIYVIFYVTPSSSHLPITFYVTPCFGLSKTFNAILAPLAAAAPPLFRSILEHSIPANRPATPQQLRKVFIPNLLPFLSPFDLALSVVFSSLLYLSIIFF